MLNNDLLLISKWACNWKMLFNPDPTKPAQEVIFSKKKITQIHPVIRLNNIQKHLGILLDNAILKINKGTFFIKKFRHSLPRKSLLAAAIDPPLTIMGTS